MLVLQDFEAITPNLLARTIETVEGGGLVVLLLKTMTSLRQLYNMTMVSSHASNWMQFLIWNRMSIHGTEPRLMIPWSRVSTSVSFSRLDHAPTVLYLTMS